MVQRIAISKLGTRCAALGVAGILGAAALTAAPGQAEARTHVGIGIGVGVPGYYYAPPPPVYYAPPPVYYAPPPPVYYAPPPPPAYYAPPGYYRGPRVHGSVGVGLGF